MDPEIGLTNAWNFLCTTYGPTNQTDVARILQSISDADDKEGFSALFGNYHLWLNQLTEIPRIDPVTHLVVGNQRPSDSHMATVLLRVLKNSEFAAAKAMHSEAIQMPEAFSYDFMKMRILNAVKSDPSSFDILPAKIVASHAVSYGATVICANCSRPGHYASECQDPICGFQGCGLRFDNARERKDHYLSEHAPRRRDYNSRTKSGRDYAAQEAYPEAMQSREHVSQKKFWDSRKRSRSRDRDHDSRYQDNYSPRERSSRRDHSSSHSRDRHHRDRSSSHNRDRDRDNDRRSRRHESHSRRHSDSPGPNKRVSFEGNQAALLASTLDKVPDDQIQQYLASRFTANAARYEASSDSGSEYSRN
jgi:hypothetical protein